MIITLILVINSLTASAATSSEFSVGSHSYEFHDESRDRRITTHVWYPVDSKIKGEPIIVKGPFRPVVAKEAEPIAKSPEKFPIVLLSHGSMGLASRLFWLADTLVRSGIVVIAPDHPGNRFGDSSGDGVMRVWERSMDLSFVLNEVARSRVFKDRIELSKVSAIGHSAGGAAVLLIGGAKFSYEKFANPVPNCEGSKDPYYEKQCQQLKSIDPKSYGKSTIENDYSDKRVKSVIALDPGFVRSFQPESFKKTRSPFIFIAEHLDVPQDEIFAKEFANLLPSNQTTIVPHSFHMSFLQACKAGLENTHDPELKGICSNTQAKIEIQRQVSNRILKLLNRSWSG